MQNGVRALLGGNESGSRDAPAPVPNSSFRHRGSPVTPLRILHESRRRWLLTCATHHVAWEHGPNRQVACATETAMPQARAFQSRLRAPTSVDVGASVGDHSRSWNA